MSRYIASFPTASWSWAERLLLIPVFALATQNSVRGIGRSLWLDETLTYWVSEASFADMLARSFHYQGQMPLFFGSTWLTLRLFDASEVALRGPAILAYLLCTVFVYRIGVELHGREAGLTAAFFFHGLWAVQFGAPDARPYTMALLWLLVATYCLIRWDQVGSSRYLAIYVVSFLATVYTHVLFASVLAVHAAYVAMQGDFAKGSHRQIKFALAGLGFGLLPVAFLLFSLRNKWELYSFTEIPSVSDLLAAWLWVLIVLGSSGGLIVCLIVTARLFTTDMRWSVGLSDRSSWSLVWMWTLWPALLLFLASHARGASVFVARYFSWQVPGLALLAALVLVGFAPIQMRRLITIVYFVVLLPLAYFSQIGHAEDWRGAVEYANREIGGSSTPVLVWTGLVESKNIPWVQAAENRDYMLAPASFYGLRGETILVPSPAAVGTLDSFMSPSDVEAVRSKQTIWVLAPHPLDANQIANWIAPNEIAGRRSEQFGLVTVVRVDQAVDATVRTQSVVGLSGVSSMQIAESQPLRR